MAETLAHGIAQLGLEVPVEDRERLVAYVGLIEKWNKVYNLTAIRNRDRMVVEHILDSLAIAPYLRPGRVLDIGSGAGLPGVPLALAQPASHFTLLDSNHKRCAFLQQALIELSLTNAEVVCARVESYRPASAFDTVVSRAFAETQHFARVAAPLLAPQGMMLAMKGLHPHEELAQLPAEVVVRSVDTLRVPGLDAQRHLVVMTKA